MSDKPIIFSAPMVAALIDGRKSMTRRIIKPRGPVSLFNGEWSDDYVLHPGNEDWRQRDARYAVGDRLYVREAWKAWSQYDDWPPARIPSCVDLQYLADEPLSPWVSRARPSIHMPRWASRLTLTVTEVKVERLQEISEADARAEGITDGGCMECGNPEPCGCANPSPSPREGFVRLWESLHGDGSWWANPWIVAVRFTVARHNIDSTEAAA